MCLIGILIYLLGGVIASIITYLNPFYGKNLSRICLSFTLSWLFVGLVLIGKIFEE